MEGYFNLGYDLRKSPSTVSHLWSSNRREKYMLRNVDYPLSVDCDVWPVAISPANPTMVGLWHSTEEIYNSIPNSDLKSTEHIVIQISVLAVVGFHKYWKDLSQGVDQEPEVTHAGRLSLLGFDIADKYLLSGLSNCMLSSAELNKLRQQFEGSINENGLVSGEVEAESLTNFYNKNVLEHSPFFAYRVCRVI